VYRLKSKMKVILYALGFRVCKVVAGWMFCHWRKVMVCWLDVLSLEKSDGDWSFLLYKRVGCRDFSSIL